MQHKMLRAARFERVISTIFHPTEPSANFSFFTGERVAMELHNYISMYNLFKPFSFSVNLCQGHIIHNKHFAYFLWLFLVSNSYSSRLIQT